MKNLAASVLARLKNLAKENNLIYNEILVRYAIERTLKRIERCPFASQCILKGGNLFVIWNKGLPFRATMDADLEYRGDGSPENLKRIFTEVAQAPGAAEDGMDIDPSSVTATSIREDDQYGGVRVNMTAHIGTVRIPVQFDVGIGDAITPPPRKCRYPVLLSGEAPCLKVYPRETVIAEKFETLVKRGLANSRMKDYYDLWHLSRDTNVNPSIAKQAVARTFARRKTPLPQTIPDGLSDAFGLNASKIVQWKAFLRKNRLTVGGLEFVDIVRTLRDFLMPLCSAT